MELLAHIRQIDGERTNQTLKEHCGNTAIFGAEGLKNSGFYHTVKLACMLHDMGKAKAEFNEYMEKAFKGEDVKRGSVNHTFAGVIYLLEKCRKKDKFEKLTAELAAYAIGAHHGMFDCVELDGKNGFSHRLEKDRDEICYDEAYSRYFEQIYSEKEIEECLEMAVKEVKAFLQKAQNLEGETKKDSKRVYIHLSLLVRFLLSSVIYGDRKDTSDFMSGRVSEDLFVDWGEELDYLEEKISRFDNSLPINKARQSISDQCLGFAQRAPGIYKLEVPTGGGKTLSTLRYALAHAKKFRKKRIIFIIPLLSVLDQNAAVLREFIKNKDLIFEHHSNVIHDEDDLDELSKYHILADRWESPVIVSTMVQLLEILFGGKTSSIGRMQALFDSVIVIDEVQQLPKNVTYMFNAAMNFLKDFCGATIILSSATQPVFEDLDYPMHIDEDSDMVKITPEQMKVFERAEIIDKTDPYGMSVGELASFSADISAEDGSLLIICNKKGTARDIFNLIAEKNISDLHLYHLSTGMCRSHRTDTLEKINRDLKRVQKNDFEDGKPFKVICVSTQLVEAGIDFSFKSVIRILAGIDNLAQSAGRCNRSGEYIGKGRVFLINLKDENPKMLKEIQYAQISTKSLLERKDELIGDKSLISSEAAKEFYKIYYNMTKEDLGYKFKAENGNEYEMIEFLANENKWVKESDKNKSFLSQPFKTMGRHFKVFDENTWDVMVKYGKGAEITEKLEALEGKYFDFSELKRLLSEGKSYTVSLYNYQKEYLEEQGLLTYVFDGKIGILNEKAYDRNFGLDINAKISTEDLMY